MKRLLSISAFFLSAGVVHAATISWKVAHITGDVSEISNKGTLVEARAGEDSLKPIAVNTVMFQPKSVLDVSTHEDTLNARAGVSPNAPQADYYNLLRYVSRNSGGTDQAISFSGLTIGHRYEIQIWVSDNVEASGEIGLVLGDGTDAAPTHGRDALLLYEASENGAGQYGIGTFTADAASQSFRVRTWNGLTTSPKAGNHTTVNAVQIRDLGPASGTPEKPAPTPESVDSYAVHQS